MDKNIFVRLSNIPNFVSVCKYYGVVGSWYIGAGSFGAFFGELGLDVLQPHIVFKKLFGNAF